MSTQPPDTHEPPEAGQAPGTPAPQADEGTAEAGGPATPPPSPPPARSVRPGPVAIAVVLVAVALYAGMKIGAHRGAATEESAAESTGTQADAQYYTCGMHPWVVLPHPGPCPICGMPLVPLDPSKFSGEVTIDPVVVQNIGVRVAPVTEGPLVQTIRTVGTIDYDEKQVRDVNVKIAGWVQKLDVDTLGQPVKKGDPLFELYSPELYSAQQEYLLALKGGELGGGKALIDAARTKLQYYDVPDAEIAAIARRGKATKTLTLRSPYSGVVIEKKAFEGMRIVPGMQVFRIANLSRVWVMTTLYEYQLPYVHVGQKAVVTLPYLPDTKLEGKVVYVYPYLDTRARQAQVRIELDNPGIALKPGMYATVELKGLRGEERTLVPREAVIDTGERKVAFVSKGEGHFEPRQVETGLETDDGMIEIVKGLSPGEEVVTSGQFLLDSEAKVREALAKMIEGKQAVPGKPPPEEEAAPVAKLPEAARPALAAALDGYLSVQRALAADDLGPVAAHAQAIVTAVDQLTAVQVPEQPRFWEAHQAAALRDGARAVAQAKSLDAARKAFLSLSRAAVKLVSATGVPAGLGELDALHCPMYAQADGGASWLQPAGAVRNPYLGKAMLACSDSRKSLPVAGGSEALQ